MSNCKTPLAKVCYKKGIQDAFIWEIPNSVIDPLGYDFKLGDIEQTIIDDETDTSPVQQVGSNVVVTITIDTTLLNNRLETGYIVSNTKEAGVYEALEIEATIEKTIDAV